MDFFSCETVQVFSKSSPLEPTLLVDVMVDSCPLGVSLLEWVRLDSYFDVLMDAWTDYLDRHKPLPLHLQAAAFVSSRRMISWLDSSEPDEVTSGDEILSACNGNESPPHRESKLQWHLENDDQLANYRKLFLNIS